MQQLTEHILEHAQSFPEGAVIGAKGLLHLGGRAAVDQALSRLAGRGRLMRVGRGFYVKPIKTRFGERPPSADKVVEAIAAQRGETVASSGAAAANRLGLSRQVPVRTVYLTSGPSRRLTLGAQVVEMRHAPRWQLTLAGRPAGEAVRALAWAGPARAGEALRTIQRRLSEAELRELIAARALLPAWIAEPVSELVAHG